MKNLKSCDVEGITKKLFANIALKDHDKFQTKKLNEQNNLEAYVDHRRVLLFTTCDILMRCGYMEQEACEILKGNIRDFCYSFSSGDLAL
jgi:hypothetical protein